MNAEAGPKREEGLKGKSIYNPVVHPNLCHSVQAVPCPTPKCMGLSVFPGFRGLSEEQQLGLCPPQVTKLQFEVAAMGLSSSRSMLELVGCRLL